MSWDRRQSSSGSAPTTTLPSLANITHGPTASKPNSVHGHSPPLNQQPGDLRDSGNWSMNSARASNKVSESSFSPQLTLPPIEQHGSSRQHAQDANNPSFSYNHSPTNSTFAASTTSLHTTPPANTYQVADALPTPSPSASRRSSFDSRLGNLNLSSPINGTPAASQVSLASTLQRERGIHSDSPASHRVENGDTNGSSTGNPYVGIPRRYTSAADSGNGYTPSHKSNGPTRVAPPIIGAPRFPYINGPHPHPNAPSPTKGYPYAFPDPDFAGPPSRSSRDGIPGRNSTSSLVGSTASSIYSTNSGLLHPNLADNGNGNFSGGQYAQTANGNQHHHHHLQTRKPSAGASGDSASPPVTPYSRTPELRVSHKLAERKRRKEMKDLFDELRDQLPAERGGKSSKWEVLTKAIEYINQMKQSHDTMMRNHENMQRELDTLRNDAQNYHAMRTELEALRMSVHVPAQQSYHQQQSSYHQQNHHSGHNAGGSGRMQGIERC
ncbi:HLH-domain-containing protein [Choiromyces venosus 120613-1]|uniref:HLH-domain-containing protein n=1 Tax=Choiromyces venosus 120613-1 TaxID=1336337 RepID=A0A3N4J150_9PEZI|nr:HLH-domain-containing protein [Choiromyces venosus 120613-1]